MDAVSVACITIISACLRSGQLESCGVSAGLDAAACETAILGLPEPSPLYDPDSANDLLEESWNGVKQGSTSPSGCRLQRC